jgi:uncharacterized integral membrane protein (TIGR00697 family)
MKDHVLSNSKLSFLLGLFVSLIIGMNLLGGKVTELFGISVSVAIFMVPVTFLITDIVAEVHGKKMSRRFVYIGMVSIVVMLGYTALSVALPAHERYAFNEEYITIFGSSLRIMVASVVAFFLSQLHDVWAFEFLKKRTGGKFLWLRNNLSTMVSQAIDSLVFMFIAFYQVAPQFTALFVIELAIPYYLFKILFAALDTPFVYLGVRWLRDKSE